MGKIYRLLFLLSILFLCFFAFAPQGSSELKELPVEFSAPTVIVRDVDINNADAEALCTLPGVGPVIAQRIIERREELGGFSCIEELRTVRGIGEKTMEKIYAYGEEK